MTTMKPNPTPAKKPKAKACVPQLDGCDQRLAEAVYRSELKRRGYLKKPKAIKARVMQSDPVCGVYGKSLRRRHTGPVLVIPLASRKQGTALKRFFGLSDGEKVEALAKRLFNRGFPSDDWKTWRQGARAEECRNEARAILSLMYGGPCA